jgi:UDP-N-acetylmuramoyl-L-alanyl-D-glutamate--2,6-diaminopimelate ligase
MRVLVVGGSGAIGRRLLPQLVSGGHQVTATARSDSKAAGLRSLGAEPLALDVLDRAAVRAAVVGARPEAVIYQATALTDVAMSRNMDRSFGPTNRLRTEGLDNLLAAVAAGEALGLPHAAMAHGIAVRTRVPGRMEPVDRGQPFPVYVDYAHTDAALAAALAAVREVAGGNRVGAVKVAVVFGCGGERDPGKRSVMGRTAGELADLPIVTSDNPRGEDPLAIMAAVEEGVKASGNSRYRLVPDRREAIRAALAAAGPGWAVLVAGKGHEGEQIVGDRKLPFSDVEEIGRALEELRG